MAGTNARRLVGWDRGFHLLSREERNVVAILYHLLMDRSNLGRFLNALGSRLPVVDDEIAVFFEYTYLRDLWAQKVAGHDDLARRMILELLAPPNADELANADPSEFNRFFGAPAKARVQSPGRWSIKRYAPNIADNDFFLRVCRFKWAFNAKPDLVIHTTRNAALCIEAKVESGEGVYPTSGDEVRIFRERGIDLQSQTDVQVFALSELLGLQAEFAFLVERGAAQSPTHRTVLWRDAFASLDTSAAPTFVREWIARFDAPPH